jgi:hypothetical protein
MQEESDVDKTATFKRFLKIHDNKTLARKMITEFGEEQIAKNLDYVETQIAQGKVRSAPAFLKSSIQNNFLSEDARTAERRKVIEDKAQKMRVLEATKSERESKAIKVERAYSIACIEAIDSAFSNYSEQEQKDLRDAFLQGENFGSFQITDFRQNGWGSRMILPQAIKFWIARTKLPLISDVSGKYGIVNFEAYKAETAKITYELEKA